MAEKKLILIVDDDPFISQIISEALISEGYGVEKATDGQEAFEKIVDIVPDLIILDYMMPKLDGPEVCRKLKEDDQLKHVPIIMVTAINDVKEKIRLLEMGAEDYIVKPFDLEELIVRVKVVLRRTQEAGADLNVLTKLPSNVSIVKEMEKRIDSGEKFGICYVDLANFKAFNDRYGFDYGNKIIIALARLMKKVCDDIAIEKYFLGHIGGDDFIAIMPSDKVDHFCSELIDRFDLFIYGYYAPEDQKRGYILTKNRRGDSERFPIMRLRIAVVTNDKRKLLSVGQISSISAELKEKAKLKDKSNYVKDERGD